METLVLLTTALLGLRLAGALGARRFIAWPTYGAYALAIMLIVTATTHFLPDGLDSPAPTHGDFLPMVPPFVPLPGAMVYLTGVLELLGAIGLFRESTRRAAGFGLIALFIVMLPANIHVAVADIPFNGAPATPLWLRVPEQLIYISVALWAATSATRTGQATRRLA